MDKPTLECRPDPRLRLGIAAVALAVFCYIAYMVQTGQTGAFDQAVEYAVYSLRGPATNAFFTKYTHLGDLEATLVLCVALLIVPRTRWEIGVPVAVVSACGAALFKILKPIFGRPRPDVSLRLIAEGGFSFPSGHSMNGLICLGMIIFLVQRIATETERSSGGGDGTCSRGAETGSTVRGKHPLRISRRAANIITVLLVLEILGIGFSRIFVGVHYGSDVLGGFAVGLAFLLAATVVYDKVIEKLAARAASGPKQKEV